MSTTKRKPYDYVMAVDFTDVGDIDKRRAAYRRILRKLVREAVLETLQHPNWSAFDKSIADRIAKELVK